VKEVIIGNTSQLKQISLARNNTDKIDADKLCQALKAQVLSGVQQIVPVTLPPEEIQGLRSLFSTCRLYRKQNTPLKNRIPSLLKEQLYGFTQEEIFDQKIRLSSEDPLLSFQINQLMDRLERDEGDAEAIKERILAAVEPFMTEIGILTSMKGVSVFIAIGIIADIREVSRFGSYLRSAPKVAASNTSTRVKGRTSRGGN
jgi:transposase